MTASETGIRGEEAACDFLRQQGYDIEARNWRQGHYELDIVARRWNVMHIVEVKTRLINGLTTPEDALTPHKQRSLRRAAEAYLAVVGWDGEVQFDLAAVDVARDGRCAVRFIEDAIEYNW